MFSPYQCAPVQNSRRRARVMATYAVRRSSYSSCACRSCLKWDSTPSNFGRIFASPRSSKSIDFPRSAGLCWMRVLGSNPFAMPGTNTLSNSSPFAAWIVMTFTESSAEGCTGDHSCLSMRSTVST